MKSASSVASKYVERAGNATGDYISGAQQTSKDQSAAAIAGAANWKAGLTAAMTAGRYEKGLGKSGKQGWLDGITKKGSERYASGVSNSASKYATNSGAYDNARAAADSLPRGQKGSEANFNRVKAVGLALRKQKVG